MLLACCLSRLPEGNSYPKGTANTSILPPFVVPYAFLSNARNITAGLDIVATLSVVVTLVNPSFFRAVIICCTVWFCGIVVVAVEDTVVDVVEVVTDVETVEVAEVVESVEVVETVVVEDVVVVVVILLVMVTAGINSFHVIHGPKPLEAAAIEFICRDCIECYRT